MTPPLSLRQAPALLASLAPAVSPAHSFGTPYVLPIPLWMYVYGCAATLVITFALLGVVSDTPGPATNAHAREPNANTLTRTAGQWALWLLLAGASGCLLLTTVAGLFGNPDPAVNISMTLFWVLFLLGFAYITLFLGDLYALINPWKLFVDGLERLGLDPPIRRLNYPPRWGYWPAFFLYLLLIWLELFLRPKPAILSGALLIYSAITFAGVVLFGKTTWFDRVDPFSLYFNLIGKLAPVEYRCALDTSVHVRLRPPFSGALSDRPQHLSAVLFVLLMLSSTTYDAIHDTLIWVALFWKSALWLLQPLWGEDLGKAQQLLMGWYLAYRQLGLLLFPFLYFGFYILVLWWAKVLTRTTIPLRGLALKFCYSLIPIAVAYNFTHYFTFLITQLRALPRLISDPFGFSWHLLGVNQLSGQPQLPMGLIWHTQVGVLLAGHLVSVYLAHKIALRTFASRRQVMVSQLPLLALMIAYTTVGLWILSLPLSAQSG